MGALRESISGGLRNEFSARVKRHGEAQDLIDKGKTDDLRKAVELFRRNVDWDLEKLGQEHQATVYDQEQLSYTLNRLGDFKAAKEVDEKVLETRIRVEGRNPPPVDLLDTEKNLANDYLKLREFKKALVLYQGNYEARQQHTDLGEDHWATLQAGHDLGICHYKLGDHYKAFLLHTEILNRRTRLGVRSKDIILSRESLALDMYELKRFEVCKWMNQANLRAINTNTSDSTLRKVATDAKKSIKLCDQQLDNENQPKEQPQVTQPIAIPQIRTPPDHHRSHSLPKQLALDSSSDNSNGNKNVSVNKSNMPKPRPMSEIHFRHIASSDVRSQSGGDSPVSPTSRGDHKQSSKSNNNKPAEAAAPKIPRPHRNSLLPNPGAKSTPELGRARSTSPTRDKAALPSRAKSVSPGAEKAKRSLRQLFDAKQGQADDSVLLWFDRLEDNTQALLKESRRTQSKRIRIAILDTGIAYDHPDFAEDAAAPRENRRIKAREDFLDAGGSASDLCGHGTHCVGLLRKIAPEADIYVARVIKDFYGKLDPTVVVKAINRAYKDGKDPDTGKRNWNVDILTLSFGFYNFDTAVNQAIQGALGRKKPVLVFVAASNNGNMKEMTFPADIPGVFCVNSATAEGNPSDFNPPLDMGKNFSIVGENVSAPWIKVVRDSSTFSQRSMSGTSVATPILAAIAALVLELALQDAEEDNKLKGVREHLRSYNGMGIIFTRMQRAKLGYKNIVPWKVLNQSLGRERVLNMIETDLYQYLNR